MIPKSLIFCCVYQCFMNIALQSLWMPENNKNIKNCPPCRKNATFWGQIRSTQTHPKQLFTVNYSVFCTFEPASRHPKSLQITISNFHPPNPPSKTYRGETQSDIPRFPSSKSRTFTPPQPPPSKTYRGLPVQCAPSLGGRWPGWSRTFAWCMDWLQYMDKTKENSVLWLHLLGIIRLTSQMLQSLTTSAPGGGWKFEIVICKLLGCLEAGSKVQKTL